MAEPRLGAPQGSDPSTSSRLVLLLQDLPSADLRRWRRGILCSCERLQPSTINLESDLDIRATFGIADRSCCVIIAPIVYRIHGFVYFVRICRMPDPFYLFPGHSTAAETAWFRSEQLELKRCVERRDTEKLALRRFVDMRVASVMADHSGVRPRPQSILCIFRPLWLCHHCTHA